MSERNPGVRGKIYRHRPWQSHVVESQSRDGAPWLFEAECKSGHAAQEWIEQASKRDRKNSEEDSVAEQWFQLDDYEQVMCDCGDPGCYAAIVISGNRAMLEIYEDVSDIRYSKYILIELPENIRLHKRKGDDDGPRDV